MIHECGYVVHVLDALRSPNECMKVYAGVKQDESELLGCYGDLCN